MQPLVVEPAAHDRPEAPEATEPQERRRGLGRGGQPRGGVEVVVDEVRHLDLVEARSHAAKRGKASASLGPHVRAISSCIASMPWRTWIVEPSA